MYCHQQCPNILKGLYLILLSFLLHVACPVGYKEKTLNATKTCLRFVDTPTHYPNATIDCKKDDGDLVKLDSESLKNIFLDFIDGKSSILSKIILVFKIIVHLKAQMTKYTAVNILSNIKISMKIGSFLLIYHSMFLHCSKLIVKWKIFDCKESLH